MGHRVATETELTDAGLVEGVLRAAGFKFTRKRDTFVITVDGITATLHVRTGRLTSESVEMPKTFGVLRQLYGEAKYRAACERQGITIEGRTIDKDGNIVLMCSME